VHLIYTAGNLCFPCPQKRNMMDATRLEDGAKVILKCIGASSQELQIILYLSSAKMRSDPRNRTVPIVDVILVTG
jgi:hypothetical protein